MYSPHRSLIACTVRQLVLRRLLRELSCHANRIAGFMRSISLIECALSFVLESSRHTFRFNTASSVCTLFPATELASCIDCISFAATVVVSLALDPALSPLSVCLLPLIPPCPPRVSRCEFIFSRLRTQLFSSSSRVHFHSRLTQQLHKPAVSVY